jgi:hypothetical protein
MGQPVFIDGKLTIDSSRASKTARDYREAVSYAVSAPSDGMIEFRLKIAVDEYVNIWMSCERARKFCNGLHGMLCYHEEMGERNVYWVDYDSSQLSKLDGIPNLDTSNV